MKPLWKRWFFIYFLVNFNNFYYITIDKYVFSHYYYDNRTICSIAKIKSFVIFQNRIAYILLMEDEYLYKGRKIMSAEELKMLARNYVTGILEELTGINEKNGK